MILITGSAGKTGRAVMKALRGKGESIRGFTRNQTQAEVVRNLGAEEVVIGDLTNYQNLEKAVEGVRAVYHICPNMHPNEIEIGKLIIDLCGGKIERFVYHSVFHPQIEAMPHHWHKLRVEEILIGSSLAYTILQPTAYMQNILGQLASIKNEGIYRVPYSVDTRVSMVDLENVAEAAATCLSQPGFSCGTFELVGPGYFSQVEIASMISLALGNTVQAEEIPLKIWQSQAEKNGLGKYQIETLMKMFKYYDQYNFMGNQKSLESILGRKPTTFKGFLEREIKNN